VKQNLSAAMKCFLDATEKGNVETVKCYIRAIRRKNNSSQQNQLSQLINIVKEKGSIIVCHFPLAVSKNYLGNLNSDISLEYLNLSLSIDFSFWTFYSYLSRLLMNLSSQNPITFDFQYIKTLHENGNSTAPLIYANQLKQGLYLKEDSREVINYIKGVAGQGCEEGVKQYFLILWKTSFSADELAAELPLLKTYAECKEKPAFSYYYGISLKNGYLWEKH
jgi:hypothetical protein